MKGILRAEPGVYRLDHVRTGRTYVGSSINVKNRVAQHITALRKGRHVNHLLQDAWRDGGRDAFHIDVVCYCPAPYLLALERAAILELTDRFNILCPKPILLPFA